MNDWFPRLSPDGFHRVSGFGTWGYDRTDMGPGWTPQFRTPSIVIVYLADSRELWELDLERGTYRAIYSGIDSNTLTAGGGRWASCAGRLITRDDGSQVPGFEPAAWGDHLAWIEELAPTEKRVWVDGRIVRTGDIRTTTTPGLLRANRYGLAWVEAAGGTLEAWGLLWGGVAMPLRPTWQKVYFAVPVEGPDAAPWLLVASDYPPGHMRAFLVPWGQHIGRLVDDGPNLLHPDAVFAGNQWRAVWCSAQGGAGEVWLPRDGPLVDFSLDPRPPMPSASGRFRLTRTQGSAPLEVGAEVIEETGVRTRRWTWGRADLLDLVNAPTPNDRPTYPYLFLEPGDFDVDLKMQGEVADETHQPGSGGAITFAGRQRITVHEPEPLPPPPQPAHPTGYRLLQTGFGDPLIVPGYNVYEEMRARRLEGARIGAAWKNPRTGQLEDHAEMTRVMVQEVLDTRLRPITVCTSEAQLEAVPEYTDIEWWNEPDISVTRRFSPAEYAATIPGVMAICRRRHLFPWLGAISNLDARPQEWLRQIMPAVPVDAGISAHWYPGKDGKPYPCPLSYVIAFNALIGNRRKAITETGFHTGPWSSWILQLRWPFLIKRTYRLTDSEVAHRTYVTFSFFMIQGFEVCVGYQIHDGEDDTPGGRFGWQRSDWRTWKLVGSVFL